MVNDSTPVAMLTVGQLREALSGLIAEPAESQLEKKDGKYVYGLRGIRQLFGVSHVTAQKYKDGILRGACWQQGRKIIVDVDKALELFGKGGER